MKQIYLVAATLSFAVITDLPARAQNVLLDQDAQTREQLPLDQDAQTLEQLWNGLSKAGVNLSLVLINESAGNPIGGVSQGTTDAGQLQLGADFNLEKILGIPGASVHVTEFKDYGESLSLDNLGTGFKSQEIFKNAFTNWHFGLLTYEQRLLYNRIDIALGRTATSQYFAHSPFACDFMSGTNCGMPEIVQSESGFSLLPSATWGGKISFQVTPQLYVMTGVFEVNSFIAHTSGFDFSTQHASGVTVPVEIGYTTTFETDAYPYEVKLGGYYSDGGHADPLFNTKGRLLGTFGGTAATIQDRSGMYLLADKTLWRAGLQSFRNVAVFGGWALPFDKTEVYDNQVYAGVVWTGPFASRPGDTIGFVGNYFHVSSQESEFLNDARIKAGGGGVGSQNEGTLEIDYGANVLPSVRVTPDIQYIINPDNSSIPNVKFVPRNALVIGLQISLHFGSRA